MCIYKNSNCTCSTVKSRLSPELLAEYDILHQIMNDQAITRHVFSKEKIDEMDSRTIVVTNLDTTATEEELRKLFDFAGPIKNVEVVFDTRTLMPKGFAFVEFEILLSVEVAIIYNQTKRCFTKSFAPSHPAAKRNSKFVWRAPTTKFAPY
ncbi:unnamed protein product [Caenorhabditis brenneri]